jgi:FAD/FMN-containing dehydrogenase
MNMSVPLAGGVQQALDALAAVCEGDVLLPGTSAYDQSRSVWNAIISRHPAAIVRCASAADVVAAVRTASAYGLPVSIKAGGHNVAGHAVGNGAVMLDLSLLRGVTVDASARTAWVEGGAIWADVDAATQAHGLATPGGLISETGVAGLTLGGGVGWLRSRYGLSIDNLVAAEVVTARGSVLRASATENPDLFWALRGGGGNFGVVTRFCFALHPVGPTVMLAAPIYPLSAGPGPIRFWRDLLADRSDDIGSLVEFSTVPESDDYPRQFWGQRCYTMAALHAGDAEEGERVLAPLRELGPLVADFSGKMAYADVQKLFDTIYPAGTYRCYWKSHLVTALTDELIDQAVADARDNPSDRAVSSLWNFGGATAAVPAEATAFGDRSFGGMYSLDMAWSDPADDQRMMEWTRTAWARARRFAHHGRLYLNFPGLDADSDELTRAALGPNFARLAEIKAKYDPTNMFRFNQNIPPSHPNPDRT